MKITVINKKESVIYKGKIYGFGASFEVEEIVGKSLIERGYAEGFVEEGDDAGKMVGSLDAAQLTDMTYPQLKKLAAEMGLDASGRKDELIERICAVTFTVEDEAITNEDGDENAEDDLPKTGMPD